MVACTEQHRLSFEVNSCFAMFQDTLDDIVDLGCFIGRNDQLGPLPDGLFENSCLRNPSAACAITALHASRIGVVER